tara:strand:+ start:56 stop:820 length:765 start_codon:yes stop_codon:yes gene_type:complete
MKKIISVFVLIIIAGSCSIDDNFELLELDKQRIKDSRYVIYHYMAMGLITDGGLSGHAIFDSAEDFSLQEAENLSSGFFEEIPSAQSLCLINVDMESPVDNKAYLELKGEEVYEHKGFEVTEKNYLVHGRVGSANMTGEFGRFRETKDSLIFYDITLDPPHNEWPAPQIGFVKGNVILRGKEKEPERLEEVKVRAIILRNISSSDSCKQLLFGGSALHLNSVVHFRLRPSGKVMIEDFSDYGIYKPVKIWKERD